MQKLAKNEVIMRRFEDYVRLRESTATDIGSAVMGTTSLSTDQEGHLSDLFNIVRAVTSKYPRQMLQFLERFSRDKPEIQDMLAKLSQDDLNDLRMASRKGLKLAGEKSLGDEGDVVSPNLPDTASGELP